ncbi:MAG: glycosyltransferase family 39 protein [Chloroflexi bacterium]|nr:glycosyltransferase family 39 protein [Chloroflexota bacterium]
MNLSQANRIAILISIASILAAFFVSENVYEQLPHVEDEFSYIWQAQVFARGQAFTPSPAHPKLLVIPFVVDYGGLRFSKYPPGWPLLLALGVLSGLTSWINPILGGVGVWLTYRLGQKLFDHRTALLAAGLMATSPFFLLNSGNLLSHPWSLVLSLSLTLAWLDLFFEKESSSNANRVPAWIKVWVAGLSLGVLFLTRPITAIGVGLPFFIHGLNLLRRGGRKIRWQILLIGFIASGIATLLPVWQFLLTGNPTQNLYELWWQYDQIGFGDGIGTQPGGHNFFWVINNLVLSLKSGSGDLFGWGGISWLFIPFGLWAVRRNRLVEPVIGVPAGLILAYSIYWISPNLYGPRYYYEGLVSSCLLTAVGIFWMEEWSTKSESPRLPRAIVPVIVALLVGFNFLAYMPARFDSMRNLYNINHAQQTPFLSDEAQTLTPALVIVHAQEWTDCAGLLPLQDPWLTTSFIFACDTDDSAETIQQDEYPDRKIIHYDPEIREVKLEP